MDDGQSHKADMGTKEADNAAAGDAGDAAGASLQTSSLESRPNRRASTRYSLETPVTDLASTDGGSGGGSGSRSSKNSISSAAGILSRSKLSRARTSLERLPQPRAANTPETPPRRSVRSNVSGISGSQAREGEGEEDQAAAGAARQGRNSISRGNAELKSLLGLDAAVWLECCCLCYVYTAVDFLNFLRKLREKTTCGSLSSFVLRSATPIQLLRI